MIIRPGPDGTLHLISQPDHARLAATIISAWDTALPLSAASRAAVLFAIAEHDNGWREVDAEPLLSAETARPHDFMDLPAGLKRDIWPRGIRRLATDSPLAAALVAEHALTLHRHRHAEPGWREFFSEIEGLQAALLTEASATGGISRQVFGRAYDLLYIGDVVSLAFCNRWKDATEARGYRVAPSGGDNEIVISPDPFKQGRIHFQVTARAIPDRAYRSDGELRAAFREAPAVQLHGTAVGAFTSPR